SLDVKSTTLGPILVRKRTWGPAWPRFSSNVRGKRVKSCLTDCSILSPLQSCRTDKNTNETIASFTALFLLKISTRYILTHDRLRSRRKPDTRLRVPAQDLGRGGGSSNRPPTYRIKRDVVGRNESHARRQKTRLRSGDAYPVV